MLTQGPGVDNNAGNGQDWPPYDTVFKNPPHSYAIACGVGAGASVIVDSRHQPHQKRPHILAEVSPLSH